MSICRLPVFVSINHYLLKLFEGWKVKPENTNVLRKGIYHSTADIQFVCFGFSCIVTLTLALFCLLLASNQNRSPSKDTHVEGIKEVVYSQTTSGYCIHKDSVTEVYNNFKESAAALEKGDAVYQYALDVFWNRLTMKRFCFSPNMGYQCPGYSDIENRNVSYGCWTCISEPIHIQPPAPLRPCDPPPTPNRRQDPSAVSLTVPQGICDCNVSSATQTIGRHSSSQILGHNRLYTNSMAFYQ